MITRLKRWIDIDDIEFAIIGISLVLSIWLVERLDWWYDEAFTATLARLPLADLLRATAQDVHPPLHYLVVSLIAPIVPGEWGTRIWSILCQGVAMLVLRDVLIRFNLKPAYRLPILALICILPSELIYASSGRMYAQLQLLVLLQVIAVIDRRWWLLGIATTLALYTHNYAVFYSFVIGMAAIIIELRTTCANPMPVKYRRLKFVDFNPPASQFRCIFAALGIPILLWLPWVIYGIIPQAILARSGQHWIQPVNPGQALFTLYWAIQGTETSAVFVPLTFLFVSLGMILAIPSAWRAKQYLLIALAIGPWLLACLASLFAPLLLYRALIPSVPFVVVLIVMAIQRASKPYRLIGFGLVGLSLAVGMVGTMQGYEDLARHTNSLDARTPFEPGALVVHLEDTTLVTFAAYAQPGVRNVILSGCPENSGALGPVVRQAMGLGSISPADLPQKYYLVGLVGALSTACHQEQFNRLRSGSRTMVENSTDFGIRGIYDIQN